MICGCGFKLNPSPHCTLPCTTPKPTCQIEYRHKQFISAMLQTKSRSMAVVISSTVLYCRVFLISTDQHSFSKAHGTWWESCNVGNSLCQRWWCKWQTGGFFLTRSPRKSFHRCNKQDECWNLFYACRFIYYNITIWIAGKDIVTRFTFTECVYGMKTLLLFHDLYELLMTKSIKKY